MFTYKMAIVRNPSLHSEVSKCSSNWYKACKLDLVEWNLKKCIKTYYLNIAYVLKIKILSYEPYI